MRRGAAKVVPKVVPWIVGLGFIAGLSAALGPLRGHVKRVVYRGVFRERWQQPERVIEALGIRLGDRVADLGAGGGYFVLRLAEAVGAQGVVYAVDIDPKLLRIIETTADKTGHDNVVTVEAGEQKVSLPERVDLVLVVNTYHHLNDRIEYFARLRRCLALGGRVAVVEPRHRGLMRLTGHATPLAQIRSEMLQAGYVELATHEFLKHQGFVTFTPDPQLDDRAAAPSEQTVSAARR